MRASIRFIAEKEGVRLSSAFRVKTDSRCKLLIRGREIGRSKYMPHQGKKEIARRDRQMQKGQLWANGTFVGAFDEYTKLP